MQELKAVRDALLRLRSYTKLSNQSNQSEEGKPTQKAQNSQNSQSRQSEPYARDRLFSEIDLLTLWSSVSRPTSSVTIHNYVGESKETYKEAKEAKEAKKVKETKSVGTAVAVGALTVGTSLIGTYVISQDEYTEFALSKLDTKISVLRNKKEYIGLIVSYDQWKSLFLQRTKVTTYAKATTIGSVLGGLGGVLLTSTALVFGGFVGIAAGSSVLFWKYLTTQPMDQVSEEEAFLQLVTTVNYHYSQAIRDEQPGTQIPSAPLEENCPP
jgi:small nuclear ribonucleoprotein (snRNP)-like protein